MLVSRVALPLVALMVCASGQIAQRPNAVRAVGEATVTATPDLARISFSVETRAATAEEASAANATQTTAVLDALRGLLGAAADIRTTGYSITAIYAYPSNAAPTLTGYSATNSIEVSLSNLTETGKVLDTGTQAGATRVQTLSFTIKDPEPYRLQALRQAATRARSHAEAMVTGLGLKLGAILFIDESGTPTLVSTDRAAAPQSVTTPIEIGNVSVTARLVMEIEIVN